MPEIYHPLSNDLGIKVEDHYSSFSFLWPLYERTFASQHNRPAGMRYFNFMMSELHWLRVIELIEAKKAGRKVVGGLCSFVPEELVLAVDGILVGLHTGVELAADEVSKLLPENTCAHLKGALGLALSKVCPYVSASDVVVSANTCGGKRNSHETLNGTLPRLYVMDIPKVKSPEGPSLMRAEFKRFGAHMEGLSGVQLTAEALRKGIATVNSKRAAMHRLSERRAADPAPISGLDCLLVNQIYFNDSPERFTGAVDVLCDELDERVERGEGVAPKGTPRILVSGCQMTLPSWKAPSIIERAGAIIVGEDSCMGAHGAGQLTDDTGSTVEELQDAIADRYLDTHCVVFTPGETRAERVLDMARKLGATGVIHYGLRFCPPYQMEADLFEQRLEKEGMPALCIYTDHGRQDTQELQTRVEDFLARLRGRPH